MRLYEITEEIKAVQALVDSDELTAEMVADTMEALDMEFKDKVEAVLRVRQGLLSDVVCIEKEIERLSRLKAGPDNNVGKLDDYIKESMIATGNDKLKLDLFKITLKKPTKKLGEIDESKVPEKYWTPIPATKKLDKRALLKDAKESNFDFVTLVDSDRALLVK